MNNSVSTKVDVLNLALGLLGENAVNSYDPDSGIVPETEAGQKVAGFYNESVDEVMSGYYWQELIDSTEINVADGQDAYGRDYFNLSSIPDLLIPIGVIAKTVNGTVVSNSQPYQKFSRQPYDSNIRYSVYSDRIYTHADEIIVSYIKRKNDPSDWSPELLRVIYHNLAINASFLVTNSVDLSQVLLNRFEVLVKPNATGLQKKFVTNDPQVISRNGLVWPNTTGYNTNNSDSR